MRRPPRLSPALIAGRTLGQAFARSRPALSVGYIGDGAVRFLLLHVATVLDGSTPLAPTLRDHAWHGRRFPGWQFQYTYSRAQHRLHGHLQRLLATLAEQLRRHDVVYFQFNEACVPLPGAGIGFRRGKPEGACGGVGGF